MLLDVYLSEETLGVVLRCSLLWRLLWLCARSHNGVYLQLAQHNNFLHPSGRRSMKAVDAVLKQSYDVTEVYSPLVLVNFYPLAPCSTSRTQCAPFGSWNAGSSLHGTTASLNTVFWHWVWETHVVLVLLCFRVSTGYILSVLLIKRSCLELKNVFQIRYMRTRYFFQLVWASTTSIYVRTSKRTILPLFNGDVLSLLLFKWFLL